MDISRVPAGRPHPDVHTASPTPTYSPSSRNAGRDGIPYSYFHLLTRLAAHTPPLSAQLESNGRGHDYTKVLDLLLQQPTEIRDMIFKAIEPRDLLSLRCTNHACHEAVHQAADALRSDLSGRVQRIYSLSDLPFEVSDLSAYFFKCQQFRSACDLAALSTERLSRHIKTTASRNDRSRFETWKKMKLPVLEKRLTRSLVILQEYLNFLIQTMIDNETHLRPVDDDDYMTLYNVFDFDQQDFLRSNMPGLTEQDFVDVTATLSVLKSTCRARNVPWNMRSHTHPFASVRQVLMCKGLTPFVELLAKGASLAEQESCLRRLCREIGLSRRAQVLPKTGALLDTIHHLNGYMKSVSAVFDTMRSTRARDKFIEHQDIWDRSARSVLMQKLGRFPEVQSATAWILKVMSEGEKEAEIMIGSWDQPERG